MPKCYWQLRVKDLPKVPMWWLGWDSKLRPSGRKAPNLPLSHHAPPCEPFECQVCLTLLQLHDLYRNWLYITLQLQLWLMIFLQVFGLCALQAPTYRRSFTVTGRAFTTRPALPS